MDKVVGFNKFFNVWEVWDRNLRIVRGQFPSRWRALEAAGQFELFEDEKPVRVGRKIPMTE